MFSAKKENDVRIAPSTPAYMKSNPKLVWSYSIIFAFLVFFITGRSTWLTYEVSLTEYGEYRSGTTIPYYLRGDRMGTLKSSFDGYFWTEVDTNSNAPVNYDSVNRVAKLTIAAAGSEGFFQSYAELYVSLGCTPSDSGGDDDDWGGWYADDDDGDFYLGDHEGYEDLCYGLSKCSSEGSTSKALVITGAVLISLLGLYQTRPPSGASTAIYFLILLALFAVVVSAASLFGGCDSALFTSKTLMYLVPGCSWGTPYPGGNNSLEQTGYSMGAGQSLLIACSCLCFVAFWLNVAHSCTAASDSALEAARRADDPAKRLAAFEERVERPAHLPSPYEREAKGNAASGGLGGSPSAPPIEVSMGASVPHWERGGGGGGGMQTQQLSALMQTLAKNKTVRGAFAKPLTASTMFQSPPQALQAESAREQERIVQEMMRENNRMKQELEKMKAGGGDQQQQPASTVAAAAAVASMQSGITGGVVAQAKALSLMRQKAPWQAHVGAGQSSHDAEATGAQVPGIGLQMAMAARTQAQAQAEEDANLDIDGLD